MDISTINSDLIRGNVTTIILKALYDGTSYGYDILKLVEEKTNGKYVIKQPTLYSCLKRLEKQNLINSYMGTDDDTSGARRRYYSLTELGEEYLLKQQAEYEYSRTILDRLLSDKEFDLSQDETPFDINELRPYTKVAMESAETKVVEKVVEKPIYIEKPVYIEKEVEKPVEVEKIVYVDKPVEVEKIVYVDRYPDGKTHYEDGEKKPIEVRQHSGIIVNEQLREKHQAQAQQEAVQPALVQQPVPEPAPAIVQNQPSGIIVNSNSKYQEALNAANSKLPEAPLINRMQESLRANENIRPSDQDKQAQAFRPANYVAPETVNRTHQEAQDRAAKILGIGKYRQSKVMSFGEEDSPSGTKR